MRADAVRNRARILDAARAQIAELGPEVGMEVIAAEAGVAVGTLYRHYPSKTELVSAVLSEYVQQLGDAAEAALARVRSGDRPLAAVIDFLRDVIRVSAENEAAKAAAPALGAGPIEIEERAASALGALLAAGIQAGELRPDLTVEDVYVLVAAAPLDQPARIRDRWTELMLPTITREAGELRF